MPVYNGAKFIRDALESLLAQTVKDYELLISDNASTDETQAICEEYVKRDPRIRFVRHAKNMGAVANFRFVLEEASADIFMWAAYDDTWAPDFLSDATSRLEDGSIDFVFPAFKLESIFFGVARQFDRNIFQFIGLHDRRTRLVNFMSLHYLSHSANIVYSVFRTDFLRKAWAMQDIGNDGVFGAVVISRGRGMVGSAMFSKRYWLFWPGLLTACAGIVVNRLKGHHAVADAQPAIARAAQRLHELFPEYRREIAFIFDRYRPITFNRRYRICSISELS